MPTIDFWNDNCGRLFGSEIDEIDMIGTDTDLIRLDDIDLIDMDLWNNDCGFLRFEIGELSNKVMQKYEQRHTVCSILTLFAATLDE